MLYQLTALAGHVHNMQVEYKQKTKKNMQVECSIFCERKQRVAQITGGLITDKFTHSH